LSRNLTKEIGIVKPDNTKPKIECILQQEQESGATRWTNIEYNYPKWQVPDCTRTQPKPLIDRSCLKQGYNIEVPLRRAANDLSIFEAEKNTHFFENLLESSDKNVKHYYRRGENPIILTIERDASKPTQRVLIRTAKRDIRVLVTKATSSRIIKTLCKEFPNILQESEIFPIKADIPKWNKDLLAFESKQISNQEKIGIFCAVGDQTTEDEFLGNSNSLPIIVIIILLNHFEFILEHPSAEFQKFLKFLGEEIVLKGWKNFRGGLDTKENSTGTHSIYTTFKSFELMFHVATLLPYNPSDPQQVCKKRHIGNDVVVIIFKENNIPFDPLAIRSQFNRT